MKKIFYILFLALTLVSCTNKSLEELKVENDLEAEKQSDLNIIDEDIQEEDKNILQNELSNTWIVVEEVEKKEEINVEIKPKAVPIKTQKVVEKNNVELQKNEITEDEKPDSMNTSVSIETKIDTTSTNDFSCSNESCYMDSTTWASMPKPK